MRTNRNNEEPPEIVTNSGRIVSILRRIYKERALLSVTFPTAAYGDDRADSLIVEIDPAHKRLLLNKLYPEYTHNRLLKEKQLHARSFTKGIEVKFTAELDELIDEDGDLYYQIDIPKRLSYHQRRSSHRAATSHVAPIPITLTLNDNNKLEGVIEDISTGGMSISLSNNLPQTVQPNTNIPNCRFKIPNGEIITCELNTRFIQHNYKNTPLRIGVRFEQLERSTRRLITQLVMRLERGKCHTSLA